ncbi:hypothetical protein BH10ACT8_BH10ACT8_20370 [soil metagenome]
MRTILLKRLVGLLGVLAAVALAVSSIPNIGTTGDQLSHIRISHSSQQVLDGVPLAGGTTRADAEFYAAALRILPKDAAYHLAVGPGPGCGRNILKFFGVAYLLLPRAAVCDTKPAYWVLVGTGSTPPVGYQVLASAPGSVLLKRTIPGGSE